MAAKKHDPPILDTYASMLVKHEFESTYPQPLVLPPLRQPHKQTFIILHGRGSDAYRFARQLLATPAGAHHSIATAFPHAKFVIPTASKRRAEAWNGIRINQWFDYASLENTNEEHEGLPIEGLRETTTFIHQLVRAEIDVVGAKNIVLGGLSQGGAASLIAHLLWTGESLAAGFIMCGWLPFQKQMDEITRPTGTRTTSNQVEDNGQLLKEENESTDVVGGSAGSQVTITFLRNQLGISGSSVESTRFQPQPPLFIGHGKLDKKVPLHLGREAASCLERIGISISIHEYENLAHWYSEELLSDIVNFVYEKSGWVKEGTTKDIKMEDARSTTELPQKPFSATGTAGVRQSTQRSGFRDKIRHFLGQSSKG